MQTIYHNLEDNYKKLLNEQSTITIEIDPTNFDCNTCDSIFEQVFAFVDKNYIEDNTINYSVPEDFDESNAGRELGKLLDKDPIDIDKVKHTDDVLNGLNNLAKSELTNKFNELNKKDDGPEVDDNADQVLTDKILAGLNDVAKSKLTNKFNELNKTDDDVSRVDEELTDKILNGLKEKAMNEFTRKFEKDVAPEVDDELTDEVLTNNLLNGLNDVAKRELINEFTRKFEKDDDAPEVDDKTDEVLTNNLFNGLKEKAMNELKNQINVLPKNETAELVDIVNKEEYKDDSKEDDESLLDKNNTKLTITINVYDKENKRSRKETKTLTVQNIINNLKKNKVPNTNPNREYNKPRKEKKDSLIKDLNNATTVGKAVKILKNNDYNVNPKYNQYYNEFINTLYGRHPFSGGDNIEDEV